MKLGLIACVVICSQLIDAYKQSCGFESRLCPGWRQSYTDDFDWTRRSGRTWFSRTGPSSGHGGYGYYMYIETTGRSYGDKAKLLFSPPSSVIGTMSCLKFYYHMYGSTINRLNVFNGHSIVFTRSGQQGNRWLYAEVIISVENTITFEGISGSSHFGDIAIDDISLMNGTCRGCKHTLNDSFGHLNITYNEKFSPDCIWTLGNSGISEPVAIVSIEEVQFGYCSGFIKVLDGNGTQVFSRDGCQTNHTSHKFHEIAFEESQNITIQVALNNYQSFVRVSYCVLKNGLDAASPLPGWNFTLESGTSNSLQLRWMDINHRLIGGVRSFAVIAKSSYSSVPVKDLFYANTTSVQITELDPSTEYNVSVVAIDGRGSPFKTAALLARTDEGDCGSVQNNTLASPGYPSPYPNNMDCVYRVPIPFDKDLLILFNYFSLEEKSNCTCDYLTISDGSSRRIGTYCGYQTGKSVRVVGSISALTFVSNRMVRYHGFTLSFIFTPKSCGFENGLCHGWRQSYIDDFDWTRHSGRTWSHLTGPSSGHGGYGFYMYIKTTARSYRDKAKLLFSPPSSVIGTTSCLKFYYHMYGYSVNMLNVFNGHNIVFTKSGQQGNRWLYAEVTVFVQNTITFEGIKGISYTDDIAIDDVSLLDGICTGCMKAVNDSFGHLNITYNEKFSPDCIWAIGNSGISEPVAIVSIEEVQLGFCSGYIRVLDGSGTQVFTREGCLNNHTSSMFLEIAFRESQNVTIEVSLNNHQSNARVTFGISKDGLDAASPLAGWIIILQNKTSNSLQLQWMDINHRLNGGARFFVVIAKSSYSSVPVRKIFPPNITSAEITGLDPYTVYNVSVVAIDGNGSPFNSSVLQARTDESGNATLPPFISRAPTATQRPTVTTSPGCGSAQSNYLKSPGYPYNYRSNMNCIYRVPIPFGQYLSVYFHSFYLERHSNCAHDYLKITDGSTYYTIGTYCGYLWSRRVHVVGSVAVLTFHSDGSIQHSGFYLSFSFSPQPRGCDFENGLCPGWYQSHTDDFNWWRLSRPTSSSLTGPSSGHGGYGFYMYIETSSPRLYGDRARLQLLPPNSATGKLSCLKFYYHMYGATINQLNVFNGNSIVFTKSGQQGNRWLFAEVAIFVQNTITFEGIRGSSDTGDIALDDVYLVDGNCTGCIEAINDSFGQLNITFNKTLSPDCKWIIGNAKISQPIAILSIEKAQLSYCSGYITVLDGNNTQIFSREGCLNNHNSSMFFEIAFQESQDITIRVSLNNKQSYVRLSYGILKDGLDEASPLAGWSVTLETRTPSSLQLRWMDINHRLNGGVRFFVVIAKSSYSSVPVRKLLSPNITRAKITGLNPNTVYNVRVVAIDDYGSPFRSTVLKAKTSGSTCGFERGLCRGWYQSYTDDFDWTRRSGRSWYYNSGPSSGHGGYGFYMLISNRYRSYGDKAKLSFTPPNSVIGTISCLKFYYYMYGATRNQLNVFNGNNIVFARSGQQGNRWLYAEVAVFLQNTITFEGIVGSYYRYRTASIAIDDVSLMDGACAVCGSVQDNMLRSPGYPGLYPSNLLCVYRVNIPPGKDLKIYFNYFNLQYSSSCTYHDYLRIASNTHNVIGTFCGQKTGMSVRLAGNYALLTFHTDPRVQKTGFELSFSDKVFPVSCNFDFGLCPGWSQSTADVFNWTRGTGKTWSTDTGPSSEHTSESGYYMYIEASPPRREGDNAKLVLSLPGNGKMGCLSFYYHMYGENMGTLNVFIGNKKVFSESGDHGNTWIKADRTIVLGNNVIFEGIRGSGFQGDLAIDDVLVTNGSCAACTDKLPPNVCSLFASSDTCASLYNYAAENCAKTCGFCGGCTDELDASVCSVFASSGSCVSLYNYTSMHCAKTCGFCGGIVSTTARPNIVTYASSPTATPSTFSSQSTYKPASSEPLDNELKESVVLRVTGLDVAKWEQGMKNSFKAEVARSATEYCSTNAAKCLPNTTRSRRRRSSDIVFSPDLVHILAEYPKPSPEDPEVTMIAFYLSLPPEISQGTVVSKTILTTIVESNMKTIGRSMNSTIVSVEHLRQTSKTHFRTSEYEGNHTGAIVGGVVGGCLFLFVIGALLVVYLRKRRNPEDSYQSINKSTAGALEMKEGVVSFSSDMYGVSRSESFSSQQESHLI
ncbi:MAM and LDL-receptor class A domain-containing protein 1-like isoform X3 [Acropora millepora]|uniref:MAM and LDL-receptor class A domain-containing protein 1-like isoform X3 n=1 Tax=Acropora millepora TaxID=45264 RepID=UPI001CF5A942|nr:MAM and LDL-receptor class A domain-containing protein 1-like isoform X3 [Acropora millepora]